MRRAGARSPAALGLVALGLVALALSGCSPLTGGRAADGAPGTTSRAGTATSGSGAQSTSAAGASTADPQDPARYAPDVVRSAREAGVDAQLVLAILYNESYKPHDPQFEREWQKLEPDAAFGVANMHRAAFDDTKRGRPFAHRSWEELPDDPALAIEAESWYLHDLRRQLPSKRSSHLTVDELCALGFNAGPGNMRAFARGVAPGPQARDYLNQLHHNWSVAADVLAHPSGG